MTETRKVAPSLATPRRPVDLRRARQRFERAYVEDIMRMCEGDRQKAIRILGISLSSLKEKLRKEYGSR